MTHTETTNANVMAGITVVMTIQHPLDAPSDDLAYGACLHELEREGWTVGPTTKDKRCYETRLTRSWNIGKAPRYNGPPIYAEADSPRL